MTIMRENSPTPQIFNPALRRVRRERAARRTNDAFLLRRCGEDAAERIIDINRQFKLAIIIGLPDFVDSFVLNLPPDKKPENIIIYHDWPATWPKGVNPDLILSGLVLQSLNEVPLVMRTTRENMVPDGLFLSALLGGESLLGLRRACFGADQDKYGGIIPRVAPMIDVQQAAGLLNASGFALPVIDRDPCRVNYTALKTLIEDLRDIGETNYLTAYTPQYEGRTFLDRIKRHYFEQNVEGKYEALFDILWATGWSPHESQQKPLKPGSAKTRLSDALKDIRAEIIDP